MIFIVTLFPPTPLDAVALLGLLIAELAHFYLIDHRELESQRVFTLGSFDA